MAQMGRSRPARVLFALWFGPRLIFVVSAKASNKSKKKRRAFKHADTTEKTMDQDVPPDHEAHATQESAPTEKAPVLDAREPVESTTAAHTQEHIAEVSTDVVVHADHVVSDKKLPPRPAAPAARPSRPPPPTAAKVTSPTPKTSVDDTTAKTSAAVLAKATSKPAVVAAAPVKDAVKTSGFFGKLLNNEPAAPAGKPKFVISVVSARPMNSEDSSFGVSFPPPAATEPPKPAETKHVDPEKAPTKASPAATTTEHTVTEKPVKPAAAPPRPPANAQNDHVDDSDDYSTSDSSDGEGIDISSSALIHPDNDDDDDHKKGPPKPARSSKEDIKIAVKRSFGKCFDIYFTMQVTKKAATTAATGSGALKDEDRAKILLKVKEGKITQDEAVKLITALDNDVCMRNSPCRCLVTSVITACW